MMHGCWGVRYMDLYLKTHTNWGPRHMQHGLWPQHPPAGVEYGAGWSWSMTMFERRCCLEIALKGFKSEADAQHSRAQLLLWSAWHAYAVILGGAQSDSPEREKRRDLCCYNFQLGHVSGPSASATTKCKWVCSMVYMREPKSVCGHPWGVCYNKGTGSML